MKKQRLTAADWEARVREWERSGLSGVEWLAFGIAVLRPIAWEIKRRVFRSPYIFLDDTTLRVQDRKDPRGIRKGRLWCAVASDTPYVAFVYKPDWCAKHAADFLRGYQGFVHGDGYAGYAASLGPPGSEELVVPHDRRLGCGMHVRRKFESASEGGEVRALVALAYFRKLYAIEATCKDEGLSADARLERRRALSLPVLQELYAWIEQLHPNVVPGTPLHKATTYALNQREYFERCFTDGRFEIDNGEAERQIRPLKLGEKNYLFASSENGATDIADARTIINTCKRAGVDPLAYATDVITKLQRGWPKRRIEELLPDRWTPSDVEFAAE